MNCPKCPKSPPEGTFEDELIDLPLPKVGYVSFLEGSPSQKIWLMNPLNLKFIQVWGFLVETRVFQAPLSVGDVCFQCLIFNPALYNVGHY